LRPGGRAFAPRRCLMIDSKLSRAIVSADVKGDEDMIRSPLRTRQLALLALSICCSTGFALSARAQPRIELQTCEDLKITRKQYGAQVVETAACVGPTKSFRPKGTLRNVHILATFPAVAPGRASPSSSPKRTRTASTSSTSITRPRRTTRRLTHS